MPVFIICTGNGKGPMVFFQKGIDIHASSISIPTQVKQSNISAIIQLQKGVNVLWPNHHWNGIRISTVKIQFRLESF